MKLNLGCGRDKREGYINVDIRPNVKPDRCGDASRLPWLLNDSVEEIVACDVLEHFGWREVGRVLAEWFRVLKPGGVLKLQLPDLRFLAVKYDEDRDTPEFVRWLYGGQDYPENTHRCGFDAESLASALRAAGFVVEGIRSAGANLVCRACKPPCEPVGEP